MITVYITKKLYPGPADFFSDKVRWILIFLYNLCLSVLRGSIDCSLEGNKSGKDLGTSNYNSID